MNRPARFTSAYLRRAVKVAEQSGPNWAVEILPDATIRVMQMRDRSSAKDLEPVEEVVF